MDRYRELIQENIDFDLLLQEHPYDVDTLKDYMVTYDADGRMAKLHNARGYDTQYEYDSRGLTTKMTDALAMSSPTSTTATRIWSPRLTQIITPPNIPAMALIW